MKKVLPNWAEASNIYRVVRRHAYRTAAKRSTW